MSIFFKRLAAETPKFFKRVRAVGLSLSATGTAIVVIPNVPQTVISYAATSIWVGAVMAAVAQLTVEDKPTRAKRKI